MKKSIIPILILFLSTLVFLAFASLPKSTTMTLFPNLSSLIPIVFYLLAIASLITSLILLIIHLYRPR